MTGRERNHFFIWFMSIGLIVCGFFLWKNYRNDTETVALIRARTILVMLASAFFTVLAIILLVRFFGSLSLKKGIYNFFIGDEGTYSLSRLQAVLWAVFIMVYQLAVILALCINKEIKDPLSLYQPSFSESAIWLLGLSLSSCIAVKQITTDRIIKNPWLKNRKGDPSWKDLLVGENGLDFSKCQMLIWTIIALFIFSSKCYYFLNHLLYENADHTRQMFRHFYEDYKSNQLPDDTLPFIPYLPWTFVVLMGLSQGAYVGKKLVPSFKVGEAMAEEANEFEAQLGILDTEIAIKRDLLATLSPVSAAGIEQKHSIQLSLQDLLNKRRSIQVEKDQFLIQSQQQ